MSYTKGVTCSQQAQEGKLKPLLFSEGVLLCRQVESLIC